MEKCIQMSAVVRRIMNNTEDRQVSPFICKIIDKLKVEGADMKAKRSMKCNAT